MMRIFRMVRCELLRGGHAWAVTVPRGRRFCIECGYRPNR